MPTTDPERGALVAAQPRRRHLRGRLRRRPAWPIRSCPSTPVHADFDNDGALDILMLRGAWEVPRRMSLLRNRGGVFEDVTLSAGLGEPIATQAAGWADYDNDGHVDLYVAGEFDPRRPDARNRGRLYHNRGRRHFRERRRRGRRDQRSVRQGGGLGRLRRRRPARPLRLQPGSAATGSITIRATARSSTSPPRSASPGRSTASPAGSGTTTTTAGSTSGSTPTSRRSRRSSRDQLGRPTSGERPRLYRNVGGTKPFRDVTAEVGLDRVVLPMGSNFGDLDNDGFLDIYLGTGRPSYSLPDAERAVPQRRRPAVRGRHRGDRDRPPPEGAWRGLRRLGPRRRRRHLPRSRRRRPGRPGPQRPVPEPGIRQPLADGQAGRAPGPTAPPSGPGSGSTCRARRCDAVASRYRTITAGSSFGGNPLACTVGLGQARAIRAVEVFWPTSGTRQTFRDVPIDTSIEITEGRPDFRVVAAPPIKAP